MRKLIRQVLKNQCHILSTIDVMQRSGKISSGIYSKDDIGRELEKQTLQLLKDDEKKADE